MKFLLLFILFSAQLSYASKLPRDYCKDGQLKFEETLRKADGGKHSCPSSSAYCVKSGPPCPAITKTAADFCKDGKQATEITYKKIDKTKFSCYVPIYHCVKKGPPCPKDPEVAADFCKGGNLQMELSYKKIEGIYSCATSVPHCVREQSSTYPCPLY